MALGTLTKVDSWIEGNKRVRVYDVQMSSGANWTAAGESLLPSQVGLRKIITVRTVGVAANSTPLSFQVGYDFTNNKLIAYGTNATPGAAVGDPVVTGNTNLSGYTVRLEFIGY